MSNINGRVMMITGAAAGFGRLIALEAAKRGAKVVACDINEEALKSTAAEIEQAGGQAIIKKTDVTKADDLIAAVNDGVAAFGSLDILINNAGTMPIAYIADHKQAMGAWNLCIDINIKGTLNGIAAVHDQMIEQGRGHVINVSSIFSNQPVKGSVVYGATKAAINYMTEVLRQESQGKIKVTTVRPTGVPATGLNGTVINPEAALGILGANAGTALDRLQSVESGKANASWGDSESIEYFALSPELLVEQVLYAADQPWGVSISDITVRASGDLFVI